MIISTKEKNRIRGLHLTESKDKRITSVLNEQGISGTINLMQNVKDFVIIDSDDGGKSPQEQLYEYLFTFLPKDFSDRDYPYDTLLEPLLGGPLSGEELEKLKNDITAQIFAPDPYDIYREPDKTYKEGDSLFHDLLDAQQIVAFDKLINYNEEERINEQSYRYEGEKELSTTQQALHNDVMRYIGQTFGSWMSPDNPPFPQEYAQSPYFDNLSNGIRDIVIRNID